MDVQSDVPLAPRTTLELGGPAEYFVMVRDEGELREALELASRRPRLDVTLLGGGSNVVVADAGVPGLVVDVAPLGVRVERAAGDTVHVTAAAGEEWDALVARTVGEGLAGLECMAGIPGRVGGVPVQNVGAYGREASDVITSVRVFDRARGEPRRLAPEECAFAYRDSALKRAPGALVVLDVTFALRTGVADALRYGEVAQALGPGPHAPAEVRDVVLALRRGKSMLIEAGDENRRSVGSFFTNPIIDGALAPKVAAAAGVDLLAMPHWPTRGGRVKLAAGWLVERAGFAKGLRRGAVGISSRHALALVHHGGGTTSALLALAEEIAEGVRSKLGVTLEREPVVLGQPT